MTSVTLRHVASLSFLFPDGWLLVILVLDTAQFLACGESQGGVMTRRCWLSCPGVRIDSSPGPNVCPLSHLLGTGHLLCSHLPGQCLAREWNNRTNHVIQCIRTDQEALPSYLGEPRSK